MAVIRTPSNLGASVVLGAILLSGVSAPAAHAATVTATGTDAAICNQTVSDATNVTAVRLSGGDCVVTFLAGTVNWTPPSNLRSIKVLLVGGGGGGGGSYDTAGAGGGGGGQVLNVDATRIDQKKDYTVAVGQGGAAGYHVARTNTIEALGQSGGISTLSTGGTNLFTAYAGGGGGSSRANATGTAVRIGGAAATNTSGGVGGGPGGGGFSGGGGGGSSTAGANGNMTDPARDSASSGGSGTTNTISGNSVVYGTGGPGGYQDNTNNVAGADAPANTGNGGGGASVGGSTYRNGGAGGSGIVIIRYSTTVPTFSNLAISGNPLIATARSANSISATVDVPAYVTFYVGKTRIPGCISIRTSGSSTNNVANCSWKPSVKGSAIISAEAFPVAPGLNGSSNANIQISVAGRTGTR